MVSEICNTQIRYVYATSQSIKKNHWYLSKNNKINNLKNYTATDPHRNREINTNCISCAEVKKQGKVTEFVSQTVFNETEKLQKVKHWCECSMYKIDPINEWIG